MQGRAAQRVIEPMGWSRRRWLAGAAAPLLLGLQGCTSTPARTPVIPALPGPAPFSRAQPADGLPEGWHPHQMRRDRLPTDYRAVEFEGRRVVHALADRSTSGLRCDVDIDPLRSPWLSWEWRVDQFPSGASVADDDRDDSPARVVLAFDGDVSTLGPRDRLFRDLVETLTGKPLPFATLMYVWDGEAERESVIAYPRSARIQYLVVESGAGPSGRWLRYRRNVVDDYRRVFGADPGRITNVGLLSDSDDLKLRQESWFGDLQFGER